MSNVPPGERPPVSGWQTPSGGQQPPGGGSQQPPPPPGAGWQQQPTSPSGGGYQPPAYGYQQQQAPVGPGGQPLAEWWKRLVAIIIDGLILYLPLGIIYVVAIVGAISGSEIDPETGEITSGGGLFAGVGLLFLLLVIVAPLVYYGVLNGSASGQTVGKKVMKIQVRDANAGGPIGVGRGFGRAAIPAVLGALCGIVTIVDGLWPLWDNKRQALHDKAVNSVVVDAAV